MEILLPLLVPIHGNTSAMYTISYFVLMYSSVALYMLLVAVQICSNFAMSKRSATLMQHREYGFSSHIWLSGRACYYCLAKYTICMCTASLFDTLLLVFMLLDVHGDTNHMYEIFSSLKLRIITDTIASEHTLILVYNTYRTMLLSTFRYFPIRNAISPHTPMTNSISQNWPF